MNSKNAKVLRIVTTMLLSLLLVLSAASFAGCSDKKESADATEIKAAEKTITVKIINNDDEKSVTIKTDAEFLAGALEEEALISEEDAKDGMIVTVDGVTADWDADGAWWALSQDGEMLMTGVCDTEIKDGDCFELTLTQGSY